MIRRLYRWMVLHFALPEPQRDLALHYGYAPGDRPLDRMRRSGAL